MQLLQLPADCLSKWAFSRPPGALSCCSLSSTTFKVVFSAPFLPWWLNSRHSFVNSIPIAVGRRFGCQLRRIRCDLASKRRSYLCAIQRNFTQLASRASEQAKYTGGQLLRFSAQLPCLYGSTSSLVR